MRFMMFMYPDPAVDQGNYMPTPSDVAGMMQYNEQLIKAGVLLSGDGLHPSAKGARISFPGGKAKVQDGPFTEAKEIIGGYWIIQTKSREEAIEWAKRIPSDGTNFVEVRQIYDLADFPQDVIDAVPADLQAAMKAAER